MTKMFRRPPGGGNPGRPQPHPRPVVRRPVCNCCRVAASPPLIAKPGQHQIFGVVLNFITTEGQPINAGISLCGACWSTVEMLVRGARGLDDLEGSTLDTPTLNSNNPEEELTNGEGNGEGNGEVQDQRPNLRIARVDECPDDGNASDPDLDAESGSDSPDAALPGASAGGGDSE